MRSRPVVLATVALAAILVGSVFVIQRVTADQVDQLDQLVDQLKTSETVELGSDLERSVEYVAAAEDGCLRRATEAVARVRDVNALTVVDYERREELLLARLATPLEACAALSSADERRRAAAALAKLGEDKPVFSSHEALMLLLRASAVREDVEEAGLGKRTWDVVTGKTAALIDELLQERDDMADGRDWIPLVLSGHELTDGVAWSIRQLRLLAVLVDSEQATVALKGQADPLLLDAVRPLRGAVSMTPEPTEPLVSEVRACLSHGQARDPQLAGTFTASMEAGSLTLRHSTLDAPTVHACLLTVLHPLAAQAGVNPLTVTIELRPGSLDEALHGSF